MTAHPHEPSERDDEHTDECEREARLREHIGALPRCICRSSEPSEREVEEALDDRTYYAIVNAVTSRMGYDRKLVDGAGMRREITTALQARLRESERAREDLTQALSFYADFEESGHSDWSVAADTLRAHYGSIPQPGEPIPPLVAPEAKA